MRKLWITGAAALLVAGSALAQAITTPPNGDNQRSTVTQYIGPVAVTIDYHSPDVHAPNGEDRRGKIWGTLVPYGLTDLGFGTCKQCPWRGGANENTTFTVSNDVNINGQKLPSGSYGLHFIPDQNEWTVIFSKNNSSWGSFTYDPAEDALRVKAKPGKSTDFNEWLTYEFTDRKPDRATAALRWEELELPWTITVPNIEDIYLAKMRNELRNFPGFNWQNWNGAAQYALGIKRYDDALEFASIGVGGVLPFIGQENFQTLSGLADAQEAKGMAEAKVTRDKAMNHPTASATNLHTYARQQLQKGNKAEAVRVWQLNAKRNGTAWPVNVGLMRAYSAEGKYKEALKYAKLALAQAPDPVNKKNLEDSIKKLEEGKDINS